MAKQGAVAIRPRAYGDYRTVRLALALALVMGLGAVGVFAAQRGGAAPSLSGPSVLAPGVELDAGMSLASQNGAFQLVMQADGNLVEYSNAGAAVWSSGTNKTQPLSTHVVMQTDGNLVIYNNFNVPLWSSKTAGMPGAYLFIDDLGQLSVNASAGVPLWEPGEVASGAKVPSGTTVVLPGAQFRLVMQHDGNLVEYTAAGAAVWASGTKVAGSYAVMQSDGNLVVDGTANQTLWSSNTGGKPGAFLTIGELGGLTIESTTGTALWGVGMLGAGGTLNSGTSMTLPTGQFRLTMQRDGNLVEYTAAGAAVWASGTKVAGSYAVMQSDGNLVVYKSAGSPVWASNTNGNPGATLAMNQQGQLTVDSASGVALWGPGLVFPGSAGTMPVSGQLKAGQSFMSVALPLGAQFQLTMSAGGNLVEYADDGTVMWASGTATPGSYAVMQSDGNLVVYKSAGSPVWASNTSGNPGAVLKLGVLGQLAIESVSGGSLWASSTGTPGLPVAPSAVTAVAGNGLVPDKTATVSWTAPSPSVIAPVWGYDVVASPGRATMYVSAPGTTATFSGLTDGVSYTFQVSALNSSGVGAASWPASNAVTPRATPVSPGAPTGLEAVPGEGQVTATWSPPVDNGGSTLTGYVVTTSPGGVGLTVGPSSTSLLITGLTDGVSYTVTVAATNSIGTGPQSQPSAPAVPATTPLPLGATVVADSAPGDWPMYNGRPSATDWNNAETAISPSTASTMHVAASATGLGYIQSSIPTVAFGQAFVGSMTGYETSFNVGPLAKRWSTFLGTDGPVATCPGSYRYGVISAPTAATVNGSTNVIYVSGGDAALYALNASTGAILWRTQLAAPPDNFSFVSPLLYNGALYTGIASYGDCPLVQGQVLKVDPLTGAIEATFQISPNGCTGGGLWGSMSVDAAGHIFFATGTEVQGCTGTAEGVAGWQLETSVDEVDANLNLVSYWHLPEDQQVNDSDFGSVPTIYDDAAAKGSGQVVAVANKDGFVFAFDRQNLSAGPIWQTAIADGSPDPNTGGSISPMAYDGTRLYAAGAQTTINGQSCGASLHALDPATGAVLWADCFAQGPLIGAVTGANGVVVVCVGNSVVGANAATGSQLFAVTVPGGGKCWSAASIANGNIFADDGGGVVAQLAP